MPWLNPDVGGRVRNRKVRQKAADEPGKAAPPAHLKLAQADNQLKFVGPHGQHREARLPQQRQLHQAVVGFEGGERHRLG